VDRTVQTPDGRTLAIEEAGDPNGRPVLVHLGTPNSRHLYQPNTIDAAVRGLRLISYDRPGYGGSDPQPGRSVADCAADVRAICAELGIERLAMWGISGGGPHVLACAALLPDLVTAAASLASLAPLDAEGLDWFDGMGELNVEDIPGQAGGRPGGNPGRLPSRTSRRPADATVARGRGGAEECPGGLPRLL
jgi:pimeloyl-ACP methyl ester carboxylesterase